MNRSLLLVASALLSLSSFTQTDPLWLRNAAISPDGQTIAFCYQGDIWRVPANGGDAISLTTNEALDYTPIWSHDGTQLAFASMRYGNADVFVMPSTGGTPARLTFDSSGEVQRLLGRQQPVIFYGGRQDDVRMQQFPWAVGRNVFGSGERWPPHAARHHRHGKGAVQLLRNPHRLSRP
ncbi:MAG: PD40 domain-containing protein [Flavobacteriales bacterium]|nr:PD40 domain-containing protein [Flavobacteriales bacterium]